MYIIQLIPDEKRNCTDIFCLIIGLVFSIALIAIFMTFYKFGTILSIQDTYVKSTYPSDSDGKVCGYDYPAYPVLYFVNPADAVLIFSIPDKTCVC